MAELISMTYEQARAEHFKALKDEAKRKMNYWATRVRRSRPNDLNDTAHIKASEYGADYSFYKDALEALENQSKWISVEERLPEESGSYLVCTRRSYAFTAYFYLNTNEWKSHFAGSAGKHITHWMPLPSCPEEE